MFKNALKKGSIAVVGLFTLLTISLMAVNPTQAATPQNSGFITVNGDTVWDFLPGQPPIVNCEIKTEFINYDKDLGKFATVSFELQPPTSGQNFSLSVVSGNLHPFIGKDDAGGGNDSDGTQKYRLLFTGVPQAQQGFMVKMKIEANGSFGDDVKYTQFWVRPCNEPVLDIKTFPCVSSQAGTGTITVNTTNVNIMSYAYETVLDGSSQFIAIGPDMNETITFTNVTPGPHQVIVRSGLGMKTVQNVTLDECPPQNPIVLGAQLTCDDRGQGGGSATFTLTNNNSGHSSYEVSLYGVVKTVTLAPGQTGSATFTGLTAGTHTATISMAQQQIMTQTVTVAYCPSLPPVVVMTPGPCVPTGGTGTLTVDVSNPNGYHVNYVMVVNGVTSNLSLDPTNTASIVMNGLPTGTYPLTITGDDGSSLNDQATLDACPTPPISQPGGPGGTTNGGGNVLGASTDTTSGTVAKPASIVKPAGVLGAATTLPATGALGFTPLLALFSAALTYALALKWQKRKKFASLHT